MSTPFDVTPLVVKRPGTVTRYGSTYDDWANPVEHTTAPGSLEGGDSAEDEFEGDAVEVEFTWNGPASADVRENDRVRFEYAGRTFDDYEVVGQPRLMTDPLGLVGDYQLVRLHKREG